jgi:hypothetical protein
MRHRGKNQSRNRKKCPTLLVRKMSETFFFGRKKFPLLDFFVICNTYLIKHDTLAVVPSVAWDF